MNGSIQWDALGFISEYLEIEDIELFIDDLLVLQEYERGRQ